MEVPQHEFIAFVFQGDKKKGNSFATIAPQKPLTALRLLSSIALSSVSVKTSLVFSIYLYLFILEHWKIIVNCKPCS